MSKHKSEDINSELNICFIVASSFDVNILSVIDVSIESCRTWI